MLLRCHSSIEREKWQRVGTPWTEQARCNKGDLERAYDVLRKTMGTNTPPRCDVLVRNGRERRHSKNCISHVWSKLPQVKPFFQVSEQVCVSTPEFCFLQLARDLSFLELLQVGQALCGSYFVAHNEKGFVQLNPLTSVNKLRVFLGMCKGLGGVKKARRAVGYLAQGARSPMETVLNMILTLPRRLGGYGLPRAELNFKVELAGEGSRLARAGYCLLDLCWPARKFALEYNGEAYHQNRVCDENRRMALTQLGWTLQFMGSEQVFNSLSRNNLVRIVAKAIGKRLTKPSKACEEARIALIEFLRPQRDEAGTWKKPWWALPQEIAW